MLEGQLVNVFPFQLNPPIVLVERNLLYDGVLVEVDSEKELKTEACVRGQQRPALLQSRVRRCLSHSPR
jgi:hypothetical protein